MSTENTDLSIRYNFTIKKIDASDTGNYTCEQLGPIDGDEAPVKRQFVVTSVLLPRIVSKSSGVYTKIGASVQLFCEIEAHPMKDFNKTIKWVKDSENSRESFYKHSGDGKKQSSQNDRVTIANSTNIQKVNDVRVNVTLDLKNIARRDNGTYLCIVEVPYAHDADRVFEKSKRVASTSAVLVLDVPQVTLDFVKAVGASKIFLNWTVNDGNAPVTNYFVQYMKEGETTFTYYNHQIGGRNLSYVLSKFEPNTNYKLKISAQNKIGSSQPYTSTSWVRTLETDPVFVPVIEVKGNTHSTITIGWHPPPANLLEFIHYYELTVVQKSNDTYVIEEAIYPQNSRNLPYMFDNVS